MNQEKGADLVAAANAPDPRSHHSKQLSNKPLSRSDSFKAEDPVTSNSEDTTVNYVYQHTTTHHISSQEQPSQLDGQQIQLERKNSIGKYKSLLYSISYHKAKAIILINILST